MPETTIYTIGHARLKMEELVRILQKYDVGIVLDVRANPYSRRAPHFNYGALEAQFVKYRIEYRYMGGALAVREDFHQENGSVDVNALTQNPKFQAGLDTAAELAAKYTACIMCREEDPTECRRSTLIGPLLEQRGFDVLHLRGNGEIEPPENLTGQLKLFDDPPSENGSPAS